MKKAKWTIICGVIILLVLGVIFRQRLVLQITGMRPFVEERFNGWVAGGADEAELDAALSRIYDPKGSGPGSWVFEMARVAETYEKKAEQAEAGGRTEKAAKDFYTASVYYYIARFPFVASPAKKEAYERHIACYLKAARSFDPPLEVVRIPYENKEIVGYLRIPKAERPPVVILTGGVDGWKSDLNRTIEDLLKEGLAVFAMDIPGTGESAWHLAPESDRVYGQVIDYLQTREDLDGSRLGAFMISFGGYYAVRLALSEPRVLAAINVGGPIALSFEKKNIENIPDVMISTIAHAMGKKLPMKTEQMLALAKPFSLDQDGFLQHPKHRAALLSINGDQDPLLPIDDLYIISKKGIKQDEWVYKGSGHCAADEMAEWGPRAAVWMREHLAR